MSLAIHYDSSFNGFLSAVFEIYRQHLDVGDFVAMRPYSTDNGVTDLFMQPFRVETNDDYARRIRRAIVNAAGSDVLAVLDAAFRSEEKGVEMKLFTYLRKLFAGIDRNFAKNPTSSEMLPLLTIAKSVNREQGDMRGMVRFNKTSEGVYVSEIEPKYNIVDLLAPHFRGRFPNGKWAIIDVKRQYGIYYDSHQVHFVTVQCPEELAKALKPDDFTTMWKSYYDSMAIEERINPRLLKNLLPVRYWKYLPERQTDVTELSIGGKSNAIRGGVPPGRSQLPSAIAQRNARQIVLEQAKKSDCVGTLPKAV